ncbi:MAG: hypothetical protein DRN68_09005, partial [Thaumarchaeota archaeon]
MTNTTRVTEEFPGEGKGVLEILRNLRDKKKVVFAAAILILMSAVSCIVTQAADKVPVEPEMTPTGWYWPAGSGETGGYLGFLEWNPNYGGWHLGQDFKRDTGLPVYAIGDGEVIESRTDVTGYGPSGTKGGALVARFKTSTDEYFLALYGHLNNPHPKGEIKAGEILGYINEYSPSHLHFGIHPGYELPTNPWRGYTYEKTNTYGWVDPIQFLLTTSPYTLFDNFETFDSQKWNYWTQNPDPNVRKEAGVDDPEASDGKVLELIFPAGNTRPRPVNGLNIESIEDIHYGKYEARLKAAKCENDEGVVTGFFTYWHGKDLNNNGITDNHEIDFEILGASPYIVYMTIWTDQEDKIGLCKVTRAVNLRTGEIWQTAPEDVCQAPERYPKLRPNGKLSQTIPDFDASAKYYVYGFEWLPDSVRFYIKDDDKEIELWKYTVPEHIPTHKGKLMFNVWHTDNWCPEDKPCDLYGKPKPPSNDAVLRVDWVKYIKKEATPPAILSVNITSPNSTYPAFAGPNYNPNVIQAIIEVEEDGKPIIGLSENSFTFKIGNGIVGYKPASAKKVTEPVPGKYLFNIYPPKQDSPGKYNLFVKLNYNGIHLIDLERDSVIYTVGKADVMLIIDRSGSMWGKKIADAKNSAMLFVDLMSNGDKAGVVSFSYGASYDYHLTTLAPEIKKEIKQAIDRIRAGGMTAMGEGLRYGLNDLVDRGDPTHSWAMVMMSDGYHNWGTHPNNVLPAIKSQNIRVYTIGLGP